MTRGEAGPGQIREAAVIGLGTMGAGIAEVLARGGCTVVAIEANHDFLARGLALLHASLDRAIARGRLTHDGKAEIVARVRVADTIAAGAAGADLAVEAVPESMDLKRDIFAQLDQACRPDAILATNTSSLSITAIAAGTQRPGRVVGLHFFNPAPAMKLVEVISTVLTAPGTAERLDALIRDLGKTPVNAGDRAGFVVNPLLVPYLNEAARLLETGHASREDIDKAATAGNGLPMGPLALLDLVGLDVAVSVLEILQAEFGGSRNQPAPLLRRLVEAGLTGRKGGRGFYEYGPGQAPAASPGANPPPLAGPATVTLIENGAPALTADLGRALTKAGVDVVPGPAATADGGLILIAAEPARRVLDAALASGRPADAVGLHLTGPPGAAPALAEVIVTHLTAPAAAAAATAAAGRLGLAPVTCQDRPGFLAAALLYPQLNDAARMAQEGYATPADIDTAMMLGAGYPRGPLQMIDLIGAAEVLGVLTAMHAASGDPALAPAPLLAEHAAAGTPFRA